MSNIDATSGRTTSIRGPSVTTIARLTPIMMGPKSSSGSVSDETTKLIRNAPRSETGRCSSFSSDSGSDRCSSVMTPMIQNSRKTPTMMSHASMSVSGIVSGSTRSSSTTPSASETPKLSSIAKTREMRMTTVRPAPSGLRRRIRLSVSRQCSQRIAERCSRFIVPVPGASSTAEGRRRIGPRARGTAPRASCPGGAPRARSAR